MTILHVITRLILGGAQQNTVRCCRAQVERGHRVVLAYGPIYGPEGSLLAEAEASGAELVELRSMRRAVNPWRDAKAYFELRRLIRRIRPDVVHTHSSKAGILGRAAAGGGGGRRSEVRGQKSESGGRRAEDRGRRSEGGRPRAEGRDHDAAGCGPAPISSPQQSAFRIPHSAVRRPAVVHTVHGLPFHERQPRWLHRLYVALERWAAKRCDRLIAITPAMVDAFVAKGIARPEQFTVIPSGVDTSKFHSTTRPHAVRQRARDLLGLPPDQNVLGIVARLDPLKGHDDLLDIFPKLQEHLGDPRLVFIGDGWHRDELRARVVAEGLQEHVLFTGLLSHEQVAQALPALEVKVLPSYQEGQSRTLIEALLCGCGIVAYDAGGIGSICIDGQTGRLVPVGDKSALADAIVWMFEHPHERRQMTDRGRALVREKFDAGMMVDQIERVYKEILQSRV